jgi:hypothetical protein
MLFAVPTYFSSDLNYNDDSCVLTNVAATPTPEPR